jgi:hypothetical protein
VSYWGLTLLQTFLIPLFFTLQQSQWQGIAFGGILFAPQSRLRSLDITVRPLR